MPDIVVIGSLNADLVIKSPRFPEPGETIGGENLQTIPGGKGANQAVAAAKHKVDVAMVGRVGNDHFAPFLLENLQSNHVNTEHVASSNSATGTAVIMVDSNGQNSIILSLGANAHVSKADVDSAPKAKILLLQFEIPTDIVLHAAQRYKAMESTVILNPAPAHKISEPLLSLIDVLIPNETELGIITNRKVYDITSAESAAKELIKRGVKVVIVTLGENGALVVTKEKTTHILAFIVNAVDTTAAGDAFIGGFAAKLLGYNLSPNHELTQTEIQEAVSYACACGALAVTKFGAQPSLPTHAEVEQFLAKL